MTAPKTPAPPTLSPEVQRALTWLYIGFCIGVITHSWLRRSREQKSREEAQRMADRLNATQPQRERERERERKEWVEDLAAAVVERMEATSG